MRKLVISMLAIALVLTFSGCGGTTSDTTKATEVSASEVVDRMSSSERKKFCTEIASEEAIYVELARDSFATAYTAENPTADEVFDELLDRC